MTRRPSSATTCCYSLVKMSVLGVAALCVQGIIPFSLRRGEVIVMIIILVMTMVIMLVLVLMVVIGVVAMH